MIDVTLPFLKRFNFCHMKKCDGRT